MAANTSDNREIEPERNRVDRKNLIAKTRVGLNQVYTSGKEPWYEIAPDVHVVDFLAQERQIVSDGGTLLDIGCGATARHSIYAAEQGFKVSAVDTSDIALDRAARAARSRGLPIDFVLLDIQHETKKLPQNSFDCIVEWSFLHYIAPKDRERYLENISQLLSKNGRYLTSCFSVEGDEWGEKGQTVRTDPRTGAELFFSSREELDALYGRFFKVTSYELSRVQYEGSPDIPHLYHVYTLEKC